MTAKANPKLSPHIPQEELFEVLTGNLEDRIPVSYRLSAEGRAILDAEAARLKVSKTTALELILREIREARKKKR